MAGTLKMTIFYSNRPIQSISISSNLGKLLWNSPPMRTNFTRNVCKVIPSNQGNVSDPNLSSLMRCSQFLSSEYLEALVFDGQLIVVFFRVASMIRFHWLVLVEETMWRKVGGVVGCNLTLVSFRTFFTVEFTLGLVLEERYTN